MDPDEKQMKSKNTIAHAPSIHWTYTPPLKREGDEGKEREKLVRCSPLTVTAQRHLSGEEVSRGLRQRKSEQNIRGRPLSHLIHILWIRFITRTLGPH